MLTIYSPCEFISKKSFVAENLLYQMVLLALYML